MKLRYWIRWGLQGSGVMSLEEIWAHASVKPVSCILRAGAVGG